MKVLVTGGAGFIGSHMVDVLLDEGYEVAVIDNLSTGRMSNLEQRTDDPAFSFLKADLKDYADILSALKGCNTVFHFAAQADIRKSLKDHYSDLTENVLGTVNLLQAMEKERVPNLVFASSSAVYGEADVIPTPETFAPVQTSLYGASKMSCENFAQAFGQFSGIRTWAFRFANVVGERARRGVTWEFVHFLLKNPRELPILGNGKQSKEYIHVADVVSGMLDAFRFSPPGAFNLGHSTQTTVDEIADKVIDEMGLKDVKRVYAGGRRGWIGDNPLCVLSIEKMKALGWEPHVSSDEAIRRNARWALANP